MLSSRQQAEADEALRAKLASLPQSTASEQAYAALCGQLLESVGQWRARADAERRRAEQSNQAAIAAVTKLREAVTSESDALLSQLRHGSSSLTPAATSCASPLSSMLAAQAGSSSVAHQHPSHLSRRVSFNKDVVMVVSPLIGTGGQDTADISAEEAALKAGGALQAASASSSGSSHLTAGIGGVSRVDEEDDGAPGAGTEGGAAGPASAHDLRSTKERRLSRTEFNEGAILKAHLPLEQLEKDALEIAKTPAA